MINLPDWRSGLLFICHHIRGYNFLTTFYQVNIVNCLFQAHTDVIFEWQKWQLCQKLLLVITFDFHHNKFNEKEKYELKHIIIIVEVLTVNWWLYLLMWNALFRNKIHLVYEERHKNNWFMNRVLCFSPILCGKTASLLILLNTCYFTLFSTVFQLICRRVVSYPPFLERTNTRFISSEANHQSFARGSNITFQKI